MTFPPEAPSGEPTPPSVDELAAFGAQWVGVFERPATQLVRIGEQGPEYHEDVEAFLAAAYAREIIVVFEWPEWRDQGHVLLETSGAMERTDALDLCKLVTLLVRQERFAEGTLAHAIEQGWMHRILARMIELGEYASAG